MFKLKFITKSQDIADRIEFKNYINSMGDLDLYVRSYVLKNGDFIVLECDGVDGDIVDDIIYNIVDPNVSNVRLEVIDSDSGEVEDYLGHLNITTKEM